MKKSDKGTELMTQESGRTSLSGSGKKWWRDADLYSCSVNGKEETN